MKRLLGATQLAILPAKERGMVVSLDGRPLTHELRTPEVTRVATQVAAIPEVREWLLPIQREFGRRAEQSGVVAEGRDLGTRIFPQAAAKFYLKADPEERARRRQVELASSGKAPDPDETRRDMAARDVRDQTRQTAPLVPAADAQEIDTTSLSVEQVVAEMLGIIARKAADRR